MKQIQLNTVICEIQEQKHVYGIIIPYYSSDILVLQGEMTSIKARLDEIDITGR
jgi:hypothetical protein